MPHKPNPEIVKFKITTLSKAGHRMQHLKLLGIDKQGRQHYIKFIDSATALALLEQATDQEIEWD